MTDVSDKKTIPPHDLHNQELITENIRKDWNEIVDIIAEIINVPVCLIMKLDDPYISVLASSHSKGNPYHPGDKEHFENSGLYCERVIKTQSKLLVPNALKNEEWKHNPDIKLNMISYLGFPVLYPDGKPFGTICVLDNKENPYSKTIENLISKFRDHLQSDLRNIFLNLTLKDNLEKNAVLLKEKEFLLKEVHHRIKNNMNSLIAILELHAYEAASAETINALKDASGRVQSFCNLYDKLYRSESFTEVSTKEYLETLANQILSNLKISCQVELKKDIEDFQISAKISFSLGIIMNEILTNIMKYAFGNMDSGTITISAAKEKDNAVITVQDNGIGIPEDFDLKKSNSFGMRLINMMSGDMGGTLRVERDNGTKFILEFPILQ